jgi:pyruvate dehydrogenase E2 component (dihydrolipoamide acetyltransferase)
MTTLKVPNLGENITEATIIAVHIAKDDQINKDDIVLELETDKATVDIPAENSGKITKVLVKVGDKVAQGQDIAELEASGDDAKEEAPPVSKDLKEQAPQTPETQAPEASASKSQSHSSLQEVLLPDLGDGIEEVGILKILVKKDQEVQEGDSLLEVETEKATLDVPAKQSGLVQEIFVQEGQKVKIGSKIFAIQITDPKKEQNNSVGVPPENKKIETVEKAQIQEKSAHISQNAPASKIATGDKILIPASPIVRRFAREVGVDLTKIQGTLERGRISIEDIKSYLKQINQSTPQLSTPSAELPDFSLWGSVEKKDFSNIKKVTARVMAQTWQTIPHVTNFHEADITNLETIGKKYKKIAEKKGVKITATILLTKACAIALQRFTNFNASYDAANQQLIVKNYIHLALAVDTAKGLVVPVVRDVDKKDIFVLAKEVAEISEKARSGKLPLEEMKGQSFTISSLGGVGNVRHFTPIINAPDVAILGISRSSQQPRYQEGELTPRTILPISLSYDHRVIDGAEATGFMNYLIAILEEPFFPFST